MFLTQVVNQIVKEGNVKIVETLSDDNLPGNPSDPEHLCRNDVRKHGEYASSVRWEYNVS